MYCKKFHIAKIVKWGFFGILFFDIVFLLFFVYVNDLSNGLKRECNLFADDTSLFFVAYDFNTSESNINKDSKQQS